MPTRFPIPLLVWAYCVSDQLQFMHCGSRLGGDFATLSEFAAALAEFDSDHNGQAVVLAIVNDPTPTESEYLDRITRQAFADAVDALRLTK